jgi:hypothetical protein
MSFALCVLAGCGSRTELETLEPESLGEPNPNRNEGSTSDATSIPPPEGSLSEISDVTMIEIRDASTIEPDRSGDERPCIDSDTSPVADVFGTIARFAGGRALPPGHYRVEYVDGCMKYSVGQDWSVQAYANGTDAWWLVGDRTSDKIAMPPGTMGFLVGAGGFATFDECVAANQKVAPLEIDFRGGPLGVWLQDDPYVDNVAGENGRSPRWRLVSPGSCVF